MNIEWFAVLTITAMIATLCADLVMTNLAIILVTRKATKFAWMGGKKTPTTKKEITVPKVRETHQKYIKPDERIRSNGNGHRLARVSDLEIARMHLVVVMNGNTVAGQKSDFSKPSERFFKSSCFEL